MLNTEGWKGRSAAPEETDTKDSENKKKSVGEATSSPLLSCITFAMNCADALLYSSSSWVVVLVVVVVTSWGRLSPWRRAWSARQEGKEGHTYTRSGVIRGPTRSLCTEPAAHLLRRSPITGRLPSMAMAKGKRFLPSTDRTRPCQAHRRRGRRMRGPDPRT